MATPPPLGVEDLAILSDVRSALFGHVRRPLSVGRYEIRDRIGRGGAGCVFRAFDPDLQREVAIKLVQERGASRATARRRVFKEAQALARLSHPNVVAVYDVGEYDLGGSSDAERWPCEVPREGVFIAMELLVGQTVQAWLDAEPRSPKAIVARFVAAGRGLAAAHDAELVHRDFKPSNIFLTADGAVKVLDFGVAGVASRDVTELDEAASEHSRTSHLGGTPWYMAPEQYARGHTDPRSDQWSFCFALHDALFGRIAVADMAELQRCKTSGTLASMRRRGVPAAVQRALARGLAVDPQQRFASMHALLDTLAADARQRSMPFILIMGAAGVLACLGAATLAKPTRVAALHPMLAAPIETLPDVQLLRAEALLEAGHADEALDLCRRMLDRHDAAPADQARALLCRARVDRDAGEFDAAAQASERAHWLASEHDAMDVAARAAAQAALNHLSLSRVNAATDWVRHGDAAVRRASGEMAYVRADLGLARASTLVTRGREAEALPIYEAVHAELTGVAGEHSRASANALKLVANSLQRLGRAEEALPKYDAAVATLRALLGERHMDVASALNDRATSLHDLRRHEEALTDLRRALEITASLHGQVHPDAAMIRHNIGYSLDRLDRRPEAVDEYRRALAIRIATHGPDHFKTLKTQNNLGRLLVVQGEMEEGERLLLDALARHEEREPHPLQRQVLANLAEAAEARGDMQRAARYRQRGEELVATLAAGAQR